MQQTLPETFGASSTTDEVLSGVDLTGKRVLVTGVSAGLGVETARALVAHGAAVVGTARNLDKARHAAEPIHAAVANGGSLHLVELDLASLSSVRYCADSLLADRMVFDLIVANAGVMACPKGFTEDGFETQFGTNHLGHFVLINRLNKLLSCGSRVVVLSSNGHRFADVDLEDPNFERTAYTEMTAYGQSKTANALFAVELDRRLRHEGIRATAVHPGAIRTELLRHASRDMLLEQMGAIDPAWATSKPTYAIKTVAQGAATSIWAGVVAPAELVGGKYCEDCHVAEVEPRVGVFEGVMPYALDKNRAQALWDLSEQLVGERFE